MYMYEDLAKKNVTNADETFVKSFFLNTFNKRTAKDGNNENLPDGDTV